MRVLVSRCMSLRLRLSAGQESLSRLQKDEIAYVENVEVSAGVFESVDDILSRNREVEQLLGKAEEKMSLEYLADLVRMDEKWSSSSCWGKLKKKCLWNTSRT